MGEDIVGVKPRACIVVCPSEPPVVRGGQAYTCIHLGPAYIAAELEKRGFEIRAYDMDIDGFDPMELAEKIMSFNPDIIGLSVSSPGTRFAKTLIKEIKKEGGRGGTSGIKCVIACGGAHIGGDKASSLLLKADSYFTGEADKRFADYARDVCNAGVRATKEDASRMSGGEFPVNLGGETEKPMWFDCGIIERTGEISIPQRRIFDLKRYRFTPIAASRGCPFVCAFCSMSCSGYRKRRASDIFGELEDIDALVNEGLCCRSRICVIDDVFTFDGDFAWEVASILGSFDMLWSASTRVDLVDAGLLEHMKRNGLIHLSFGIESGDYSIRQELGKDISDREIIDAFHMCARMGIKTRAYGIIGSFSDDMKSMKKTVSFIESLSPTEIMYSPLILYPGTAAWDRAVEEGVLDPDAWAGYMESKNPVPVYVPLGLTYRDIEATISAANKRFYLSPKAVLSRFQKSESAGDVLDCAKAFCAMIVSPFIKESDN